MSARRTDLPHVTDILRDAGLVDVQWFSDHARERGTALHRATELYDLGDLDPESIDPEIAEPFARYVRFVEEVKPEILGVELEVEVPGSYCGKLDKLVRINGREGIIDQKGQPSPADPIQLAGYASTFSRPLARWNLYLRVSGSYRLVEHTERRKHDAIWRAALTVAAWRREHGLI